MTLDSYRPEFEKVVTHLAHELGSVRTGRATPALVDGVVAEAYGSQMSLQQLATITTVDARTLLIDPWDKTVLKEIEKAIRLAQPSLNPVSDGKMLRIPMPQLTEEARRDLTKLIGQKVEQAKQGIRKIRDDARTAILAAERAKELAEDDRYRLQKKLDELTEEYAAKLKEFGEKKVAEIMTV
ncbi:ribosome recycling factor [Candidatus Uhrbacteria bacterium]|nr:ribosome recycling factor [Candidatus Uhrbacteria bacterium]